MRRIHLRLLGALGALCLCTPFAFAQEAAIRKAIAERLPDYIRRLNAEKVFAGRQFVSLQVERPVERDARPAVGLTPHNAFVLTAQRAAALRGEPAAEPESTQTRRRDQEREESWCADHGRLRAKLAERGYDAAFRMQLPAGARPVKVVAAPGRAREAAAAPQQQRRAP